MITSGVHVHSFNLKLYDTPFVTRNKTEYFRYYLNPYLKSRLKIRKVQILQIIDQTF